MKLVNLATVSVATTAGGTEILSEAAARIASTEGLICAIINPSVDIVLVDAGGLIVTSAVPGAVAGTVANSAVVCAAGVPNIVIHRAGPLRGISTSGTATVKITLAEGP